MNINYQEVAINLYQVSKPIHQQNPRNFVKRNYSKNGKGFICNVLPLRAVSQDWWIFRF